MSFDQGDTNFVNCDTPKPKSAPVGNAGSQKNTLGAKALNESFLLPLGAFYMQKYGLLFQIPSSAISEIVEGILFNYSNDMTTSEIRYVYQFTSNTTPKFDFPMHFELFRTRNSSFIHLRVRSVSDMKLCNFEGVMDDIFQSTLRASIVNSEGKYVQGEKLSYGTKYPNGDFLFQIPNFVSILELLTETSSLLNSDGSLNIHIQFHSVIHEFPDSKSQQQTITYQKYYGIFHQFVRDQGFNSILKIELMKPKFTDVTLKCMSRSHIVEQIPAHAVMLSAFSSKFNTILQTSNEINFNEFAPGTIRLMLDFIYGGTLHTTDLNKMIELIKLANEFKVVGLRNACICDMYNMFGKPKGLKSMIACFKLGQLIKSISLVEKAVENLIWLIHNNPQLYNEELDKIEAKYPELIDDLMKMEEMLGGIVPIEEEVRHNLVTIPSEQVKLLGSYTESFDGILFIIPKEICSQFEFDLNKIKYDSEFKKVYASELMDIQREKLQSAESKLEILIEKRNKTSSINLRLVKKSEHNTTDQNPEFSKTQLQVSVFDHFGRIAIESTCHSFLDEEDSCIWEIDPFLTLEYLKEKNLINENEQILFRVGILCSQNSPTLDQITDIEEAQKLKEYNSEYLSRINRDFYQICINTQFRQDFFRTPDQASIYVFDSNNHKLATFRLDPVIVSAFSKVLKQHFIQTAHIGIPVDHFSVETIQLIINYFYGGSVTFDLPALNTGLELLCAAQELEIFGLKSICLDMILNIALDMEHGILFYKIAHGMNSKALKNRVVLYFRQNYEAIKKSNDFLQLLNEFKELKEYFETTFG